MILALDLGVFHRKVHRISLREALVWSVVWTLLGLLFTVFIYFAYDYHWFELGLTIDNIDGQFSNGSSAAVKYLTGYILERSLSIDNIFVIAIVFRSLATPAIYQHRVLFWGILGALVLRGVMIAIGVELISRYHWILYVFGFFLIITAVKMLVIKEHNDPTQNKLIKWLKHIAPFTDRYHGQYFVVRAGSKRSHLAQTPGGSVEVDLAVEKAKAGTWMLTPLALVLALVEIMDVVFAVDSIPAIFAITADPFLVFTSNVLAIFGLRALYFALAGLIDKFRYLKISLAFILALVGLKMVFSKHLKDALGFDLNLYLLSIIILILAFGILASLSTEDDKSKN
ncbi:MAG: TerC/Alx family metal homeostasis membrane protein [Deltaproteobacteria bacterium]|nr:TerC/Alx family metal homeostasis membrane protein [Deltaproteobacteria bacterium]